MARSNAAAIHGKTGYQKYHCRCNICTKAYAELLERRRLQRKNQRKQQKQFPVTTNTTSYDTLTRGQYERLRGSNS